MAAAIADSLVVGATGVAVMLAPRLSSFSKKRYLRHKRYINAGITSSLVIGATAVAAMLALSVGLDAAAACP